MGVAEATAPPEGHRQLLAGLGEIPQQDAGAGVAHFGAARHLDQQGVAAGAGRAVGAAAAPVDGQELALVLEVQEGLQVAVGPQHHVATATAVAPRGTAGRNVLFASKSDDAVAPAAGLDRDARLIDELHEDQT